MSNRQGRVLKSLADLRPIEKRIELVVSGIASIVFKGEAHHDFEPEPKSQVHRAWKMSKLDQRQQIAWQSFMDDVRLAHGKSGGIVCGYGEYTDRGTADGFKVPTAYENTHYRRLERLIRGFLSRRERALLVDLLQDTLRGNGSLTIETIGLVYSGYNEKVSARAAGIAHIQTLLGRLADFYQI